MNRSCFSPVGDAIIQITVSFSVRLSITYPNFIHNHINNNTTTTSQYLNLVHNHPQHNGQLFGEVGEEINGGDCSTRRGQSVSHRPFTRLAQEHSRRLYPFRASPQVRFVGLGRNGNGARGRWWWWCGYAPGGVGGCFGLTRDAAAVHRRALPWALAWEREGGRNDAVAGELDAGAPHEHAVARGEDG